MTHTKTHLGRSEGVTESSERRIHLDTSAKHAEHVYQVAQGGAPASGIEEVSVSWQRCLNQYAVNPMDNEAPRILTDDELKGFRQPLDQLIFSAQEEIDRLYKSVRAAGYTLLFCDTTGVVVEHRGDDADASRFRYWGTWRGGVWSEASEGTNGIGTCIAEQRPVTVHRSQHFRSRHMNLSCSGAPIFGVDGRLIAVLDVSAIDPELSEGAHALTGALTVMSARAIEERFFRERFCQEWIVGVTLPEESNQGMLLAVDGEQRIVGADRIARTSLLLEDHKLRAGVSLWTLFERNTELFRRKGWTDIPTRLTIVGTHETSSALITPPERSFGGSRIPTDIAAHTRPRLDLIGTLNKQTSIPQMRGGLPPRAIHRVQEYVEAHLSENMELTELAAVAGVSRYHFARQFKHSAGITPHYYLVKKRVERAQDLLARTDLSLSEIAVAAGFSDQSHLARHFRQMLGMTPREFRWSQR